jgi:N-acyl-D-amino-acid deacylase
MKLLIRNGKIIDGTGNPWFLGDIEIEGDEIKQIARKLNVTADRTIDAEGMVVSPGFMDPHAHRDGLVLIHPDMEGDITQGITTGTLGLCGVSPFPDKETYLDHLSHWWGGAGLWWTREVAKSPLNWHSLKEYASVVTSQGISINVVPFLGFTDILWKAGFQVKQSSEIRKITPAEMEKVKELTRQGMEEGSPGFTSSFDYYCSRYVEDEDYVEPLKIVAEYNGVFMPHTYMVATPDGVKRAIAIAQKAGVQLHVSHMHHSPSTFYGNTDTTPECIGIVERARTEGKDITFDIIQNPGWAWPARLGPRMWRSLIRMYSGEPVEGTESLDSFIQHLQDPEYRKATKKRFVHCICQSAPYWDPFFKEHYNDAFVIRTGDAHLENMTLGEISRETGIEPLDIYFDACVGAGNIFPKGSDPLFIWHTIGKPEIIVEATNHPLGMPSIDLPTIATPKEEQPNPFAYGAFPKYFVSALAQGTRIEDTIRKMSSYPAQMMGIYDRGILRRGMKADIVILDPKRFRSPADNLNPVAKSLGLYYVIVNGKIVLENGKLTQERPGQVLLRKM